MPREAQAIVPASTGQHRHCTCSVLKILKSMPPSLSELKVLPSFCFAFKIPDDVTATITHAHLGLIWYHLFRTFIHPLFPKPVSWLGFFCRFLQQEGSRINRRVPILSVLSKTSIHAKHPNSQLNNVCTYTNTTHGSR